jgi:hypothetical protein
MPKQPYKKDKVHRVNTCLYDRQIKILKSISDKSGVSQAELIRNAVDAMYLKG